MQPNKLPLPNFYKRREHVLLALGCYWPKNISSVTSLPIKHAKKTPIISGPLRLVEINLPTWATHCGLNGRMLVPAEVVENKKINDETWRFIDWWLAAFILLEAWHERVWELQNGPIHSYSFHLKGWDKRAWQHAWVNRIGLFLRAWAIDRGDQFTAEHLGHPPDFKIHMTHDVDAVQKTLSIRLKQDVV